MKKTAYLLAVVVLLCAAPAIAQGPFNDVPTDHWAYDAVNTLQKDGIVIGYPDGTFGGKRAMSRYEFAVAIARLSAMIPGGTSPAAGVTQAQLQDALKPYALKSDIPDITNLATKADVEAIKKLVDEFRDEIAALGVDVDALKRDVCALAARVDALEAEMKRVKITGNANVFAIANDSRSGFAGIDLDEREIPQTATLGRSLGVVRDFDLNIVGRVSEMTTANATIDYGNYLNYIRFVDDYIDGTRPTSKNDFQPSPDTTGDLNSKPFADAFFPYYLYINSALGKGQLNAGRFPIQFTPYTLKKIDVDSYTSILKTDDGNYPIDGISLANRFGGIDITLFACKNNENDYLQNGLTGQPNAGLFGASSALGGNTKNGYAFFSDPATGIPVADFKPHAVGGLDNIVAQTAGARIMFGTPWKGNLGATYYQSWSQDSFLDGGDPFDQARVFGADLTIPVGNFGISGSWTESQLLVKDNRGFAESNLNSDNTAWDAKVSFGLSKLGIDAGYKSIQRQFAAAGSWDKIGRWTNPTNVKGPYADLTYPLGRNLQFVANGEFLSMIDTVNFTATSGVIPFGQKDDQLIRAQGGLRWGLSKTNSLDLGYQWIQYSKDTPAGLQDDAYETYLTIGWAHQLGANTGFKIGYQFIGYTDGNGTGPYSSQGNGANHDYRAGEGVVQFGVSF